VAVADLNGDGIPDLAVANHGQSPSYAGTVSVLLGNGDGTFQAHKDYATGTYTTAVAAVDVNGDGVLDLVAANRSSDTVSVLLGNGDGSFQVKKDYECGISPVSLAVADLNGDGLPDLITANNNGPTVSVLLNLGNGTAGPHGPVPGHRQPRGAFSADASAVSATATAGHRALARPAEAVAAALAIPPDESPLTLAALPAGLTAQDPPSLQYLASPPTDRALEPVQPMPLAAARRSLGGFFDGWNDPMPVHGKNVRKLADLGPEFDFSE
jgi:hypothetical protein